MPEWDSGGAEAGTTPPVAGDPDDDVNGDVSVPAAQPPWRRLSGRMLLIHPVNELLSFLPALVPVLLVGRARDDGMPWQVQAAFVVVPVLLGILRYYTTTYRVTAEQLQLRRGLLQRATLTAKTERVRAVDVTAPPLHRLLGLAKVQIGTGGGSPFELNGLTSSEAARLRVELLHRVQAAGPSGADHPSYPPPAPPVTQAGSGGERPSAPIRTPPPGESAVLLGAFEPAWIRFAPFTFSGWVTALAVWGFLSQFGSELIERAADSAPGHAVEAHLAQAAWWTLAVEALLLLSILITLLSISAYVLSYWGYRLTRFRGGTLQVHRGLLTTRSVSIEEARVRGVSLSEPLLLRLPGAASLAALLTGSRVIGDNQSSGLAMLAPPAPAPLVRRIGGDVLGTPAPLAVSLVSHGPAARRRRYTRAVLGGLIVLVGAGLPVWWWDWPRWIVIASAVPLLAAPMVGAQRYRALGHAVADRYLVSRAGVFPRRTEVLLVPGIIGWNVESSFFQRRVGLVTLVATTAAGPGGVRLLDVPVATAYRLLGGLSPQLSRPFRRDLHGTAAAEAGRPR